MLDFICILLIFFEIIFTVFCVKKLISFEIRVNEIHVAMLEKAKKFFEINDEVRKVVKKLNKFMRIITNKKFHQIRKILMMSLDIIQVIILLKSLNLSKGLKSINFETLKKVAYARIGQQLIRKFLNFAQNLCAV